MSLAAAISYFANSTRRTGHHLGCKPAATVMRTASLIDITSNPPLTASTRAPTQLRVTHMTEHAIAHIRETSPRLPRHPGRSVSEPEGSAFLYSSDRKLCDPSASRHLPPPLTQVFACCADQLHCPSPKHFPLTGLDLPSLPHPAASLDAAPMPNPQLFTGLPESVSVPLIHNMLGYPC